MVYLQGPEGPLTETVKGRVKLHMIHYEYDEAGKVVPEKAKTVPMDWDVYLDQRRMTFAQIHRGDNIRMKEANAALDEWYGQARSQDAQAKQAKEEGQEASGPSGEGEGPAKAGGQGHDSRTSHAKTATRSPSDDDTPIVT